MKKIVVSTAFLALTTMILVASPNAMATSKSTPSSQVSHFIGTYIDNSNSQIASPGAMPPPLSTIKFAPQVNIASPGAMPPPLSTIKAVGGTSLS